MSSPGGGATTAATSVLEHRFGSSAPYTLGVEEEYMLLDPQSWDLVQYADAVLASAARDALEPNVKSELMQSVIEVATPVCLTAAEVGGQLRRLRGAIAGLAAAGGYRFASAGTHPFGLFEQQEITGLDRYRAMVEELQAVARQQLIFGLHIHAAVDGPDKAIQVVDGLLVHVAELLALSANSPLWRGQATGLASCRQMIFSALPRTGMPPRFASYEEYAELVGALEQSGAIPDYTFIWWDVRPHPRLGTVELRICDAVTRVEDAVALAAYVQALVKMLCEEVESGRGVESHHRVLTAENKWLAARYGLEAPLADLGGGQGARAPARELVRRTLRSLEPHARELGCERELEGIAAILAHGNGAQAQLRLWGESRDARALVRELAAASLPAGAA